MNGGSQAAGEGQGGYGPQTRALGNYRMLRPLGRGRTGEVYLAEQMAHGTPAAVKVFLLHLMNEERGAFLDEMRQIAALRHPHMAQILEYGIVGDMPYLAMTYAPHGTLSHMMRTPQTPENILPYVEQVADALHCAHEHTLLHLDLQPGNLLLGEHYELLLSGIGLTLLVQEVRSSSALDVVGNVLYLAPEQLRGHVGPASDQYALGVMVYEWLCGRCPFEGTFIEVGKQHLHSPVPSLRAQVPALSPQIEQVVLRALAKEPEARFESVKAFARAFERACQPQTFPPFSLSNVLVSTAAASNAGQIEAQPSLPSTPPALSWGQQLTAMPVEMNVMPAPDFEPVTPAAAGAIQYRSGPTPYMEQVHYAPEPVSAPGSAINYAPMAANALGYAPPQMEPGAGKWSKDNPVASQRLPAPDLRLAARPSTAYVNTHLPPRPDMYVQRFSRRTMVLGLAGLVGLAAVGGGAVWYLLQPRAATLGSLLYTYTGHTNQVLTVAWSPGSQLASTGTAHTPASTPRIVSGSLDHTVQVWDALSGAHALTYKGHSGGVEVVAWSPDGKTIASGATDRKVQIWNAVTGKLLLTYSGHHDGVLTLAWSPDGKYIASAGKDATVQVWDTHKGHHLLTYSHHKDWVGAVAWSPNGKYIASASADRTVQVWDALKGHRLLTYSDHNNKVWTVAWASDSQRLASGGDDATVQVWDAATGHTLFTYKGNNGPIETVAWSPDGKRIASGGEDKTVQLWDATNGENAFTYSGHPGTVWDVAWSSDGSKIASASLDHTVQVWQAI